MKPTPFAIAVLILLASLSFVVAFHIRGGHAAAPGLCASGCITSYHYDDSRQGVNSQERILKASTLSTSGFKFQDSAQVDGQVYAQPLYMSGLPLTFSPTGNAVFVATEHGSVYALEGASLTQLQTRSLIPAGENSVPQAALPIDPQTGAPCANITYEVGITGTPVIDVAPPTASHDPVVFAVVKSQEPQDPRDPQAPPLYFHRIHAWDPIANTDVSFDIGAALGPEFTPLIEHQRAGLALGHDPRGDALIYVVWGSHCDSNSSGKYHGWIAAFRFVYSTQQFALVGYALDEHFNDRDGGIWMAGAAPAIDDATGDFYVSTGNGFFNAGRAYGQSVIRLKENLDHSRLLIEGSYTPNKWKTLNQGGVVALPPPDTRGTVTISNNIDLGSGGVVLAYPAGQSGFAGPFEVLAAGKEGVVYAIDPASMGDGSNSPDGADPCDTTPPWGLARQCFSGFMLPSAKYGVIPDGAGARGVPAFWAGDHGKGLDVNLLYTAGSGDTELRYWQMPPGGDATFSTVVYATGQPPRDGLRNVFAFPGAVPVVSWDDTVPNPVLTDAILWLVDSHGFEKGSPAKLLAYPAYPVAGQQDIPPIFEDALNGPAAIKFQVPVVVNGQVYVAGQAVPHVCTSSDPSCPGLIARFSQ
jgi:hypothetical protein